MRRMSLSDVWFLYRARLRARAVLVQEGFAIVGIAVGVALLFASQVAATSLTRSVAKMTHQIVGDTQFQLQARGPAGFDERLLTQARAVPGVRVALPVLEQQANAIGPHGQRSIELIGTDPRFAHFAGPLLRRFSARQLAGERSLALPVPFAQSLGVGPLEPIKLQIGAKVVSTLVGATLTEADIGDLVHSPITVAPIRYAQRIAGLEHRATRIFVQTQSGREREAESGLRRLAARANVNLEPAGYDATLFSVAAAPATQSQTLFSAISALVGFMFALNAMLMTVPSRRRLIEDVRRQGATRGMTVQILVFDAVVLAVVACVAGLALGDLLSIAVFHPTPGYLSFAFPVGNQRVITWSSVAIAALAGFGAAGLGVCWPLRDLVLRPLQNVEQPVRRAQSARVARMVAGVGCLLATTVVLLFRPQSAIVGVFTLVLALACLLPTLFDAVVSLFDRLQRPFNGAAPLLAVTELRTPHTRIRSLAIAATGAIALFGVVAIHGAQLNLERGLDASSQALDGSSAVWVLPAEEDDAFVTIPFDGLRTGALAHLPGVRAVGLYRGSFLNWGDRRMWVLAPSPGSSVLSAGQLVNAPLASTAAKLDAGGWVVLSQTLADEHGLRVGSTFRLPSPRPLRFRVAALSTNLGWPPGAMIMNAQDYGRAWGSGEPSAYQVRLQPGASPAVVRTELRRALRADPSLAVETAGERSMRHRGTTRQGLSRLTEIRVLVLVAAVLAVTGAMAASLWQRRELVAFIKCQGYRRGTLWRWLLCECALLLATGGAIGAAFGVYGQLLLSHALATVTGFPIVFHVGALVALSSFMVVTVAAAMIVAVAGYFVVRVPPRTVSPAY
jgi:putative ABC transport system permease protein